MKILISPGFGAGWSTWMSFKTKEARLFALTCPYLIEAVESGNGMGSAVARFQADMKEKFGLSYVCVLGAEDLVVENASGQFMVSEYDGSESVTCPGDDNDWMIAD